MAGRPRRLLPEHEAQWAERYRAGETIQQIEASSGWSYTAVRAAILRAGVELRPAGRRPRAQSSQEGAA